MAADGVAEAYGLRTGDDLPGALDIIEGQDAPNAPFVPFGFVRREASGDVVAYIRGTRNLLEWIDDLRFFPDSDGFENGFEAVYRTLRLRSGAPFSSLTGIRWAGHSLGAILAAFAAVRCQGASFTLMACPKGGNQAFSGALGAIPGVIYALEGDIVPAMPLFGYAALPAAVRLQAAGRGDLVWHHALSTYRGALQLLTP